MLAYLATLDAVAVKKEQNLTPSPGLGSRQTLHRSLIKKQRARNMMLLPGFEPWPGPKQGYPAYPAAQFTSILAQLAMFHYVAVLEAEVWDDLQV
jgi:hypothetical protein